MVLSSWEEFTHDASQSDVALLHRYRQTAMSLESVTERALLRASFPTTRRVVTHPLTISAVDELEASVRALIEEAYETVGPGTR